MEQVYKCAALVLLKKYIYMTNIYQTHANMYVQAYLRTSILIH